MKQFYTYIYSDPRSMVPFYVGKGHGKRAYKHLKCKNNGNPHLNNKIKQMLRESIQPLIEIAEVPSESEAFWFEADLIASIGRLDLGKGSLLNLTDGGEGCSNPTQAVRHKIRVAKLGSHHSAETKEYLSQINLGKTVSLKTIERSRERMIECWSDPSYRKQHNHRLLGLWDDPEYRSLQSHSRRKSWEHDHVRRAAASKRIRDRNLQDNPATRIDIRAKMSMKALARPKVSCIECRQIVSINTFRQHFEGRHI